MYTVCILYQNCIQFEHTWKKLHFEKKKTFCKKLYKGWFKSVLKKSGHLFQPCFGHPLLYTYDDLKHHKAEMERMQDLSKFGIPRHRDLITSWPFDVMTSRRLDMTLRHHDRMTLWPHDIVTAWRHDHTTSRAHNFITLCYVMESCR